MASHNTSTDSAIGHIALAVKTTLIGGMVFLLPLGLFLLVFSEIMNLFLQISAPISSQFPQEDWLGVAANNIIAWAIILLVCYGAGLAARFATVSKYSKRIDGFLSDLIPGYNVMATSITGLVGSESFEDRLTPVVVRMGSVSRYGLEAARNDEDGTVTIYLPGSPNPMSGIVVRADAQHVSPAGISANDMIRIMRTGGQIHSA